MAGPQSGARGRPADAFTERTPRVVAAAKLHRAAARRSAGTFLVEGTRAVSEALLAGAILELFATVAHDGSELVRRARGDGVRVSLVTDRAAGALSDTVTPQGLVGVCGLLDVRPEQALRGAPRLVTVLVDVGEPGNAGTVLRTSDAAGADAVLLAGASVDVHNGKCVRASTGSLFHLPVARHPGTTGLLEALHAAGLQVLAAAADGEVDLDGAGTLLAAPTAWLFGSEAHGLDPGLAARADHRVRVPIHGRAESLNLATAAAVCLYASARAQRADL